MAFGDLFLAGHPRVPGKAVAPDRHRSALPFVEQADAATGRRNARRRDCGRLSSASIRASCRGRCVGREWSQAFLDELPPTVDPCAENGEFHTVVVDGPMFRRPIPVQIGETVERDGFFFADIVPVE